MVRLGEKEVDRRVLILGKDKEVMMRRKTIGGKRTKEEEEKGPHQPRKPLDCLEREMMQLSLNPAQALINHMSQQERPKQLHRIIYKRPQIALEPLDRVQDLLSGLRAATMRFFEKL